MTANPETTNPTPQPICAVVLTYHADALKYDLGNHHPLNPLRMQAAVELMHFSGLLGRQLYNPALASDRSIRTAHSAGLIAAVRGADHPTVAWAEAAGRYGLAGDTPAFQGMHEAGARSCGYSLAAAQLVHSGQALHAFNPNGGHHHPHYDRAAGFGIYNDVVVAIRWLVAQGHRVMYIDSDVHHGDGVQEAFYTDDRVLTVSLHQSPRTLYPYTGFATERGEGQGYGYAVNVPLLPATSDDSYTECYDIVVPELARAFKPTIIVTQNGADGHARDPLARLELTTATYRYVYARNHALAHELCGGRLVAVGGGGYDVYNAVPRLWTILFAELSGIALPLEVPAAWIERWQMLAWEARSELPAYFDDYDALDEATWQAAEDEGEWWAPPPPAAANRRTARAALAGALPHVAH